ncbi:TonB-dependent receptor plug domain-containing protein [Flagellimonas pelagia]|uniref:Uncharacterized protein n=1 Tax=Flagellimonas pelagia TaxID=2306998 RepID=A0A3A1NCY3_9FLAO|nr:TonB-dependent receptor plug domain-containing protein [Allomuricauda maritima]RIV42255.1 hypothetical protein D2V05_19415 [Allomuricauda maritima]TXJ91143.1 hypothetical protein FQ017_19255 [Allomuricauda maritima]
MKRKTIPILVILVISLISFNSHGQDGNTTEIPLTDNINFYSPEKTYLHTDKDMYMAGDTIWFKAYLLDGLTHKKSPKSRVVYVELLDSRDSIVDKRRLYVEDISGYSAIPLPKKIQNGSYGLRAYTKFMLNDAVPYFQNVLPVFQDHTSLKEFSDDLVHNSVKTKNLSMYQEDRTIQIHFFPEGGTLVAGLSTTLALKITDADGNPLDLEGAILDSNRKTVAHFKSDEGLALVYFKPKTNTSYYAMIHDDAQRKYFLPPVSTKGYSLSVKNRDENIIVQMESTEKNGLDGTVVKGYMRGGKIIEHKVDSGQESFYALKIPTKDFPNGMARFTLDNKKGEPICQRTIFVDNKTKEPRLSINISPDKPFKNERTNLSISIKDSMGTPIKGDFSVSITPLENQIHHSGMKDWFLLESDFIGTINNLTIDRIGFELSKPIMDAFMLTKEREGFILNDLEDNNRSVGTSNPEKGIMISGKVTCSANNEKMSERIVSLSILENAYGETQVVDKNGHFSFGPYVFNGKATAILQLKNKNDFPKDSIIVDPTWPKITKNMPHNTENPYLIATHHTSKDYNSDYDHIKSEDYQPGMTYLNEVVVKEKRKTIDQIIMEEINSSVPYSHPDVRVFRDSIPGWYGMSAIDLLARKGFRISGDYPNQSISLLGGSPGSIKNGTGPLVLVDGVPAKGLLNTLRASEVLFIDVLRFASATLYGSRAASGVIAVYTNRTLLSSDYGPSDTGMVKLEIQGFDENTDFKPATLGLNGKNEGTLYWDPKIEMDASGIYSMEFFSGNQIGKYVIEIKGITENGQIVNESRTFEVSL